MSRKLFFNITIILFVILTLSSCEKKLNPSKAEELIIKTIYPKKITADYNIQIRYETKESPEKWKNEEWKIKNDNLEKAGLLKQQIIDTTIEIYVQSEAKYKKRHQYLYKVVLNNYVKSLLINPVIQKRQFNELDYYNQNTGRTDRLKCKIECGEFKFDKIVNIDFSLGISEVIIEYKEKYYGNPFNEIIDYGKKHHTNDVFYRKIIAHKYAGEDWQLSY